MFNNPIFWQAALFSGGAVLFVAHSVWWFYFSRMDTAPAPAAAPSPRLAVWLAGLLGLSAAQLTVGALWDGSMHIQTGEIPAGADFLWPPHLMIYSSFLLSFVVALVAIAFTAIPAWREGARDPRQWVRRNPYVGAVALASTYSLLSIPGDALWHQLFGIDLTAWSPPHVLIAATMAAVMICAVGLLAQARDRFARPAKVNAAVMILLSLMLNVVYIIGVVEWEYAEGHSVLVETRPIWNYPLVGGALAFFTLALARRLTGFRWAATATASLFYLFRLAVTLGLDLTGNVAPTVPLAFILGAVLLDAVAWQRVKSGVLRYLGRAAAYTAGYTALALPLLALRVGLADFTPFDYFMTVAMTLLVSLALLPAAQLAGERLASERAGG